MLAITSSRTQVTRLSFKSVCGRGTATSLTKLFFTLFNHTGCRFDFKSVTLFGNTGDAQSTKFDPETVLNIGWHVLTKTSVRNVAIN